MQPLFTLEPPLTFSVDDAPQRRESIKTILLQTYKNIKTILHDEQALKTLYNWYNMYFLGNTLDMYIKQPQIKYTNQPSKNTQIYINPVWITQHSGDQVDYLLYIFESQLGKLIHRLSEGKLNYQTIVENIFQHSQTPDINNKQRFNLNDRLNFTYEGIELEGTITYLNQYRVVISTVAGIFSLTYQYLEDNIFSM